MAPNPGTNQFYPFAIASGANVMSVSDYQNLSARQTGFAAGIALSEQLNMVWRQSSEMSAMLGQLMSVLGYNATDDGNINNLMNAFANAMQSGGLIFGIDISSNPNAIVASLLVPIPALVPGMTVRIKKNSAANSGPFTLDIGLGAAAVTRSGGAATQSGDAPANAICDYSWDGTQWQMVNFQGFNATTVNNNTYTLSIPTTSDTSSTPNTIVAPFSPAITSVAFGDMFKVRLNNTLTGPANILINAIPSIAVVRPDGTPTQLNDAFAGEMLLMMYDGTKIQIINSLGVVTASLSAPQIYYVNGTTGSDSLYDGSSATVSGSHGPFKTIGHAVSQVYKFNMNGFNITINVADGTYNESLSFSSLNGSGNVFLVGNHASPQNVALNGLTSRSGVVQGGGNWGMDGFYITAGSGPNTGDEMACITIQGGTFTPGNLWFGTATGAHCRVSGPSYMPLQGCTWTIVGNALAHIVVGRQGLLQTGTYAPNLPSLVVNNPVAFSSFVSASELGVCQLIYASITNPGYVSGAKFSAALNGVLNSNGAGVNYYPGSIAGSATSGGQYA